VALLLGVSAGPAAAELCPSSSSTAADTPSEVRTLRGHLVYHDGIRQWYELQLNKPTCGEKSIQLIVTNDNWRPLEMLRGCYVKSTGDLDFAETGYYSLNVYEDVKNLAPTGKCARQRPFHDYSKARPDPNVRAYSVRMDIDYRRGDHPVIFRVRTRERELRPWQAYASYWLTGGFVLYGLCGYGFVVDKVFGTPEARPFNSVDPRTPEDMASFDPETAASKGIRNLHLGYTCIRLHRNGAQS
jgi:hypothetical protein